MDVKTAFFNEKLEEEVYIIQPEGFISIDESKVCKLQRSIYGLKQASRSWNMRFDKCIKSYGFIRNGEESCIYNWTNDFVVEFLVLYKDDVILIKNDISILQKIKI